MGYIRHDAIVVTGHAKGDAEFAAAKAKELGLCVSEIVHGTTNGYVSFFIAPDGSKEGWEESEKHNVARIAWIEWAKTQGRADAIADEYTPGRMRPCWFDWAHLSFGGDDSEQSHLVDFKDKPKK